MDRLFVSYGLRQSVTALALGFAVFAAPLAGAQQAGHGGDLLRSGFEDASAGPTSDEAAARFLAQTTFGATQADIQHLRQVGYQAWLNEQFAATPTHELDYLNYVGNTLGENTYQNDRLEAWFLGALGGPDPWNNAFIHTDQLRQRVAFALSQIFVVSDVAGSLGGEPTALTYYYDILTDNAFGNYRALLEQVTLSPEMGEYLNMLGNQKPNFAQNIHPDENYAREVNQLFSVGLEMLNLDGTQQMSGGQPIPTYQQDVVTGFAHVFTGWTSVNCATGFTYCGPDATGWLYPMIAVEAYHDEGAQDATHNGKQLLNYPGVSLPGGLLPVGGRAEDDMQAALDNIFYHPNVAPFISKQLIQRLVTSNPSPAYVQRVATKFNNNGSGVRGDLKAVVQAIMLDPEARWGQWQQPNTFGKLREPDIRLTHLWRAMAAQHVCGQDAVDSGSGITYYYLNPYRYGGYSVWNPEYDYEQAPLRSPTVFNFFKPGYSPPGELTANHLVGPEFQITTDSSITNTVNNFLDRTFYEDVGSDSANCDPNDTIGHVAINQERDLSLAGEATAEDLVNYYDKLFMSGQMSGFMHQSMVNYLNTIDANFDQNNWQYDRIERALYLIETSPEYSIQK